MSAMANARWVGTSQGFRILLQMGSVFVLSRLLLPADFGLVAMAAVVTNLANVLRDLGTAAAVVQKRDLDEATLGAAFWFSLSLSLFLGLALAGASPLAAQLFRTPALAPVLALLALAFPLAGLGSVPLALLERQSRFARIAAIEIAAGVVGFGCALAAAWARWGAFSLVVQTLASALVSTALFWWKGEWRIRSKPHWREVTALWRFSGHLSAFNLVNYCTRNADSFLIGRVIGPVGLGVYSLAYRIMLFPVQNLTYVCGRALFPVMSRNQDALADLSRLYVRVLAAISALAAPMMAGLFVLREPFVAVVLGAQWAGVARLLAWLAPTGFIQSLVSTTGAVFMARGRTDILFRLGILSAILHVGAFVIGIRWGVEGVAACYLVANAVNAVPALGVTLALIRCPRRRALSAIGPSVVLAVVMAAVVELSQPELKRWLPSMLGLLGASVGLGAVVYLALSWVGNRPVLLDLARLAWWRRPTRVAV